MIPVKSYSRLNAIYDSIPAAIDREIEKVLAKYSAPQIEVDEDAIEWDNISSDLLWTKNIPKPNTADELYLGQVRQAQEDWWRRTGGSYNGNGMSAAYRQHLKNVTAGFKTRHYGPAMIKST